VLCVTASNSGICKAVHSTRRSMYAYWTRHSIRKCAPDCHIFVKGLSVAPDKQRLMRKQIKILKHRGHKGALGTAGLSFYRPTPGSLAALAALGMTRSF
jgi:hypothetical protein